MPKKNEQKKFSKLFWTWTFTVDRKMRNWMNMMKSKLWNFQSLEVEGKTQNCNSMDAFVEDLSIKLSCDNRFQRAFTACRCVFKVITLIWDNQGKFFENATACSKRTLKTTVAMQLKFYANLYFLLSKWAIRILRDTLRRRRLRDIFCFFKYKILLDWK